MQTCAATSIPLAAACLHVLLAPLGGRLVLVMPGLPPLLPHPRSPAVSWPFVARHQVS